MIDITKLTDAELRQLAEDGLEMLAPVERMVTKGIKGTGACPICCGTMEWTRSGREWSAECLCGWNAAGMLPARFAMPN